MQPSIRIGLLKAFIERMGKKAIDEVENCVII